jgi:hypothetical protein
VKPGRNEPCPCGSGTKYKHCCGLATAAKAAPGDLSAADISELVGLIGLNRPREAEVRAFTLLERHANAGMLWKILGVALMRQNKDALHTLRRTTELLPLDAEAHGNLGAYLCDRQLWRSSRAMSKRWLM